MTRNTQHSARLHWPQTRYQGDGREADDLYSLGGIDCRLWLAIQADGDADIAVSELGGAAMTVDQSLTIADLIQQRQTARQQRDFGTADDMREQLAAVWIAVVDQPDGEVRWHRQ